MVDVVAVDLARGRRPERNAHGPLADPHRQLFADVRREALRVVDAADGSILATADATYVAAPEERKRELKRSYGFRGPVTRRS